MRRSYGESVAAAETLTVPGGWPCADATGTQTTALPAHTTRTDTTMQRCTGPPARRVTAAPPAVPRGGRVTVWVLGDQLSRRLGALATLRPGDARILLVESD